jgi:hypothetical protein
LFRNRPELAPELLRDALDVQLPHYTEVCIRSESLTEIQPAEYRADLVVLLLDAKPVLGIVVEVQLAADERKRFARPVYAVGLRARIKCPVCLFVFTHNDAVARWCARPIDLGGGNHFTPLVLGPAGVPIVTSPAQAKADPELAVLSATSHGHGHPETAAQIAVAAMAASVGLDADRSRLYVDLVFASLSQAARKALQAMDPAKYEYQSSFAKRYVAKGRAKGRAEGEAKGEAKGEARGRAEMVLKLLTLKFGALTPSTKKRVASASALELDGIAERVLSAKTLREVFASQAKPAKKKR